MHYKNLISSPLLKSSLKTFEEPWLVYILKYLVYFWFFFSSFLNHMSALWVMSFRSYLNQRNMPKAVLFTDEGSTYILYLFENDTLNWKYMACVLCIMYEIQNSVYPV